MSESQRFLTPGVGWLLIKHASLSISLKLLYVVFPLV